MGGEMTGGRVLNLSFVLTGYPVSTKAWAVFLFAPTHPRLPILPMAVDTRNAMQ